MKTRTLAIAMLTVFGASLTLPAFAQDNFPDVLPDTHWAYEAVENLKREGIIVGYPNDGTYKGPRNMTRYEFAVALNAAYQRLKMLHDGQQAQIDELRKMLGGGDMSDADKKVLGARVDKLEKGWSDMKKWEGAISDLQKGAKEFEKELAALGVDVDGLKKEVEELKKSMAPGTSAGNFAITGDMNVMIHTGEGRDGSVAMGIDGRLLGLDDNGGNRVSMLKDFNVYHELGLKLTGTGSGPKWWVEMAMGNMIGTNDFNSNNGPIGGTAVSGYGNMSQQFGSQQFREGASDFYISSLGVEFDNAVAGVPVKTTIGRVGVQTANPYLYKRTDFTPYFSNERWDNGNWTMDGVVLNLGIGQNGVRVFAGRNSKRLSGNGVELNPIGPTGLSSVEGTFGVDTSFKLGTIGDLNLAYLLHSEDGSAFAGDRIEVYGGQLSLNVIKDVDLMAGYGKSNLKAGSTNVNDNDNEAIFANAKFMLGGFNMHAGYRRVENNYNAAGAWERIGTNYNPKNIENFMIGGSLKLSDTMTLNAGGEFGETILTSGGIPAGSKITNLRGTLDYTMNEFWMASFGYEDVKVNFASSAAEIKQSWATLGLGYNMGKNSMLKFTYQYGTVENGQAWGGANRGNFKGNIIATQLSVKF